MNKLLFVGEKDLSLSIAWKMAFMLLSLDLTDRYWPEFGLDLQDRDGIRRLIREYIEAEEALNELSEEEYHFSMQSDLINDLLDKITNNYGDTSLSEILNWIEKRYLDAEMASQWTSNWNSKFYRLEKYPIISFSDIDKLAAFNAVAEKILKLFDKIDNEIETLEKEPKSEWDARQYAVYRKENPDVGPLDLLRNYLWHWRFIDIWHELLNLLTPAELEALELWAKAVHVAERGYGSPDVLTVPPEYRHPE